MRSAESAISKMAAAGNFCGHSSAITLLNIPFEPREAKPFARETRQRIQSEAGCDVEEVVEQINKCSSSITDLRVVLV
jgi:hypothetical protein